MDEKKLIESLSPNEVRVLPFIDEKEVGKISEKAGMEDVSVLRSLKYLEKKEIVSLSSDKKKIIDVGVNGALYRKKGLPERRLLNILEKKRILDFKEAQKLSSLSDDEFKISIGVLKKRKIIDLKNKKIVLQKSGAGKKFPEEKFIESLPLDYDSLSENEIVTFKELERRKDIIISKEEKTITAKLTEFGKEIISEGIRDDLIEQLTPEILKKDSLWKGKKFRRYDLTGKVPEIYGGKRHFVNQASDYARRIWLDLGFREMTGDLIQSSFWNFDSLFQPQDHPARDMQDTFFIDKKTELPNKEIVNAIKESHEGKMKSLKSKGWQYSWDEDEAKKLVLRTHTTVLSSQTLSKLKEEGLELPAKFFALGKNFRNETVDWKHGFEFSQTEGIVIDKNANFRHLLGYLKQFYKKMGFEKIRFRPAYFPYTEPSVEVDVYHPVKKEWVELGGAGIFRPEVVVPLLGENIPVLAWGQGMDRILMDYYEIHDLRELYKNDIKKLRKIKTWMKT